MGMRALEIVSKSNYGYYIIILAAVLAALMHVICKPMLENESNIGINPIVMAFLIYFICGIFFTPVVQKTSSNTKYVTRDILLMAGIGILEVAGLITYFYGIGTSTAVNASIFSNSEIIFALVIALLIFKERLQTKECIPFTMIIIGMLIMPLGNDLYQNDFQLGSMVTGDLLIIFSGLLCAVDITLCRYLGNKFDVKKTVQIISITCAAVTFSLIVLFQIPMDIRLEQVPSILIMSIIGTGTPTILFLMGLKLIGTVRTVLLYSTTSVFGIFFSGLFLSEVITPWDMLSSIMVLTGIFFLRNKLATIEEEQVIKIKKKTSNLHTLPTNQLILN
jgi:drug/metabolite transporter (DMT)-like permease